MLIYLLAMFGLAWIAKESDLFATSRNWLMQRSAFITRLLSCWWCVGFWSGVAIYLLQTSVATFEAFSPFEWLIWGCAGSAASALGNAVYERLTWVEIPTEEKTK